MLPQHSREAGNGLLNRITGLSVQGSGRFADELPSPPARFACPPVAECQTLFVCYLLIVVVTLYRHNHTDRGCGTTNAQPLVSRLGTHADIPSG